MFEMSLLFESSASFFEVTYILQLNKETFASQN